MNVNQHNRRPWAGGWRITPLAVALLCAIGCRTAPTSPAVREGQIAVPGGNVWYRIEGADRQGAPLVVFHGGPGVSHDYLESLGALADERPVVSYDHLSFGNSDRPHDRALWTIDRFIEELAVVRRPLDLRRPPQAGHTWGTVPVFEGASHLHPLEMPEDYVRTLSRFLREAETQGIESIRSL